MKIIVEINVDSKIAEDVSRDEFVDFLHIIARRVAARSDAGSYKNPECEVNWKISK